MKASMKESILTEYSISKYRL